IANAVHTTDERGPRRLSPFTIPSFLANRAAGHVSIAHGFRGPIGAPVTACAAGAQAIGDAARMIRSGEAILPSAAARKRQFIALAWPGLPRQGRCPAPTATSRKALPAPLPVTAMVL
ncbi:hypothetical protein LAN33_21700, partial [Mycobacterium tuberculosis]|nr:hypothetical protein [Mycobacterium tuberculosis]